MSETIDIETWQVCHCVLLIAEINFTHHNKQLLDLSS